MQSTEPNILHYVDERFNLNGETMLFDGEEPNHEIDNRRNICNGRDDYIGIILISLTAC